MKKAFFLGVNALGDLLCTTPTIKAFRKKNPDTFIIYIVHNAEYCRLLDANPHIDMVLYNEFLYVHGMEQFSNNWFNSLPLDITEESYLYYFDIKQVCSKAESFQEHIAIGFSKLLKIPIDSVRPVVRVTPGEERVASHFIRNPYFVFSMHSNANPVKEGKKIGAKDWPEEQWLRLAEYIHGLGNYDIIAIGSEKDPRVNSKYLRNLYGLPIKITAALLQKATCVITLENGIAHLSHAVDAPMVQIYSTLVPLGWAYPKEATRCRVLYGDPHKLSFAEVSAAVEEIISKE